MQTTATIKRSITDSRYAVADCYAFKSTATIERIITDSRYAVGDCDTCKSTATRERRTTDSRYAVADCYACKATATIERIITDSRYTVGNIHAFNGGIFLKRKIIDTRYRFAVIFGGNHNIRNILVYPCYGITFVINIQGVVQLFGGGFLTAYTAVAVRKIVFGISVFFFTTCYGTVMPMVRIVFRPFFRKNVSCRRDFFCFRLVTYRAGINFCTCGRTSRFFGNLSAVPNVFGFVAHFVTTCYGTVMPMVRFIACPRCGIGMRMRRLIIAAVTAVVSCTAVIVVAVVASNKPERAG